MQPDTQQHVIDLQAEANELADLLTPLADAGYQQVTAFKGYTIGDVLRHLHQGDVLATSSIVNPEGFQRLLVERRGRREGGLSSRDDARLAFGHLAGGHLLDTWRKTLSELCHRLDGIAPDVRLKWAGPDMGARMFTTARQMEVWAHGQEIHDRLGRDRAPTDRLKSIATIGVRTFGWTYVVRGLPVPSEAPYVRLTSPSGVPWEWNPPSASNAVTGSALDFCQVVTQVRNIADTALSVTGETARHWMSIAQCFAGPPETPPAPGSRRRVQPAAS